MSEDIFLPLFVAFGLFFAGYYGYAAGRWGYRLFSFGFAPVAGLLFGFAVMKLAYPGLSLLRQIVVSSAAVVGTSVIVFALLALMQRRH